jgi:hypothetical protein
MFPNVLEPELYFDQPCRRSKQGGNRRMLRMRMTTRKKKSHLSGTQLDDECVSLMFDMCVCSFLSRNICADHHTLAVKVELQDGSNGSGVSGHSTISESLVVSRPISRRKPAFLGPSKINTARDTKHFPCRTVPTRMLIILFHLDSTWSLVLYIPRFHAQVGSKPMENSIRYGLLID